MEVRADRTRLSEVARADRARLLRPMPVVKVLHLASVATRIGVVVEVEVLGRLARARIRRTRLEAVTAVQVERRRLPDSVSPTAVAAEGRVDSRGILVPPPLVVRVVLVVADPVARLAVRARARRQQLDQMAARTPVVVAAEAGIATVCRAERLCSRPQPVAVVPAS